MTLMEEYKDWTSENLGKATGRWYSSKLIELGNLFNQFGISSEYKENFFEYDTYASYKNIYQEITGESDEAIDEILKGVSKRYPKPFKKLANLYREGVALKEQAEGTRTKTNMRGGIPALGVVLRSYLKFLYYYENPEEVYPPTSNKKTELVYLDWSEFYMELADKLLEFKNNRQELLEKLLRIYETINIDFPKIERDGVPLDIDPFTVYGFFNRNVPRQIILNEFKNEFNIESIVPESDSGAPTVLPFNFTFFRYADKRKEDDIDNLWELFETALNYSEEKTLEIEKKLIDLYNRVIKQVGIKWNITQGLYWIRPYTFIHLNANNRKYIELTLPIVDKKYPGIKKGNMLDGESYIDVCQLIQEEIDTGDEYNNFIEFSIEAHSYRYDDNQPIVEESADHWTDFYIEFADTLLQYKDSRGELGEKIKSIYNLVGFKFPTSKDGETIENIDLFTIYGFMNQKLSYQSKSTILSGIKDLFDLERPAPELFEGLPIIKSYSFTQSTLLEIFSKQTDLNDKLWELFETAILYTKETNETQKSYFTELFNHIWENTNLKWSLTKILYYARPFDYMYLNDSTRQYIEKEMTEYSFTESINGSEYLELCKRVKEELDTDFITLSIEVEEETKSFNNEVYSPDLTVDEWVSLIKDETVFDETSLTIMHRLLEYGGKATCSQLALEYGKTIGFYNTHSVRLAERIVKKTGIDVYKEEDNIRWWRVLYLGEHHKGDGPGVFSWEIRPELIEALKQEDLTIYPLYEEEKTIHTMYTKNEFLDEVYISEEKYDTLRALLKEKKNIILQGAPGVGKTFAAKRLAWSIIGKINDERIESIQFHQSYSYEDFIMGYKPDEEGFKLEDGIFLNVCEKAAENKDVPYFLIIDEINRGNISKIFGELLQLIEKEYRNQQIRMPYNKKRFSIPHNLYIIGMMNTADRSLALIDYALRRRFGFFEMEPGFNSEGFKNYQKNINSKIFDNVINLIKSLNDEIKRDATLGKGFCIGHSYFSGQTNESYNSDWLKRVVQFDIIPMLNEYWFDDEDKVEKWENSLMEVFSSEI